MNATQQQGPQLPPLDEMVDARDTIKHFLVSKGWNYLSGILQKQIEGHQSLVSAGPEQMGDAHPMSYVLKQEYAKGVLQGIMISARLPGLLVEQLNTDIARANAAKEETK